MPAKLRPFALPLGLAVIAIILFYARVRHEMVDFVTWREAAVRALHGEPLYRVEDGHYQFKYFPAFALLMAPFAALDRETGKMIWFAVTFGLLAAFLRWSVVALPERRLSERTLLWIALALMAKFYAHELLLGQTNLLLGALLVAALLAIQIDQPILAGGLVGAAVFVKPYALVMLPWLAVTQGAASAATAAGIVAAGLLLPSAIYGWTGNLHLLGSWYHTVTDTTSPNLLGNDNVSFAAMWAKWIGPGRAASLLAVATSGVALALVVDVWRRRRSVSTPEYLEFALLMLLVPLLSPQGWDYVLLLGTPALVCLIDRWRELQRPWQLALGIGLVLMCFSMFDVMGRALYGEFMALSLVSVSAVVVGVGLVHLRWRKLA